MVKSFSLKAKVWLYPGKAGWHFITLPKQTSEKIDFFFSHYKGGWGSLPVQATVGKTTWKTSIFPDKESKSYLLPLKMEVRKSESIKANTRINVSLEIEG